MTVRQITIDLPLTSDIAEWTLNPVMSTHIDDRTEFDSDQIQRMIESVRKLGQQGVKQGQIAHRAGITATTLSELMHNKRGARQGTLVKLARALVNDFGIKKTHIVLGAACESGVFVPVGGVVTLGEWVELSAERVDLKPHELEKMRQFPWEAESLPPHSYEHALEYLRGRSALTTSNG